MRNKDSKLKETIKDSYNNDSISIPDIDAEWGKFESVYFPKKKRPFLFYWVFAAFIIFVSGMGYYISKTNSTRLVTITDSKTDSINPETVKKRGAEKITSSNSKKNNVVFDEIKKVQTLKTGYTKKSNISKTKTEKNYSGGTTLQQNTTKEESVENNINNIQDLKPTDIVITTIDSVPLSNDSSKKITSIDTNKNPIDSLNLTKINSSTPPPKPEKTTFGLFLINQINPTLQSSYFNPEVGFQMKRQINKLFLETGLGFGYNHFNTYGYTKTKDYSDSITGDMFRDSSVGKLASSTYLIIPFNTGIPLYNKLQLNAGIGILLPIKNKFEVTTYKLDTRVITPNGTDSLLGIVKTTENHYKFTPSIRLSCDISYKIKNTSVIFGIRRSLYNGLKSLNLSNSSVSKPSINYIFGISYAF